MAKDSLKKPKIVDNVEAEITFHPQATPPALLERVTIPSEVAVLPVRNVVIFPGTVVPLNIGREKSRRLLEDVLPDEKIIVTVCQKSLHTEDPTSEDLYDIGTAVMVLKLLRIEEGNQSLIVHGLARVRIKKWIAQEPYFRAEIEVLDDLAPEGTETEALMMNAGNLARRVIELAPNIPDEAVVIVNNIDQPGALADFVASNLALDTSTSQSLLTELNVNKRLRKVTSELQHQQDVLELSNKIQEQVRANMDKSQREYFLQEQLKAIQEELGQMDEKTAEIEELKGKIKASGMPDAVEAEVMRELRRMEKIPTTSPEYNGPSAARSDCTTWEPGFLTRRNTSLQSQNKNTV